jgi:hypothetical protein
MRGEDAPPEPSSCAPVENTLGASASLASMAGGYTLVMAAAGAGGEAAEADRRVEGVLNLQEQPEGLRTLGESATPLAGTAAVDLEAVGAQAAGALDARDPRAPGVLVKEIHGGATPEILLTFGAAVNDRDETLFDAAYTVLQVERIDSDGFAGSWRSGAFGQETRGYFCAWGNGTQ